MVKKKQNNQIDLKISNRSKINFLESIQMANRCMKALVTFDITHQQRNANQSRSELPAHSSFRTVIRKTKVSGGSEDKGKFLIVGENEN